MAGGGQSVWNQPPLFAINDVLGDGIVEGVGRKRKTGLRLSCLAPLRRQAKRDAD